MNNSAKRPVLFGVSIIVLLCIYGFAAKLGDSGSLKDNTYYYDLEIVHSGNDLQLDVSLAYKSDSTHFIRLPMDYYGTPDLHKWVTKVVGENETQVLDSDSNSRKIIPNKDNEVYLKYSIRYDPVELDKFSYAPNFASNFFYMAGCQWMVPTNPIEKSLTYKISMSTKIPNWTLYASLSQDVENIEVQSSFEDLISAGFGGSDSTQTSEIFEIEGSRVTVFINGNFSFNKEDLLEKLQQIIISQKTYFNDYDQPFYYITVLPRTSLLAGASIPNLFYCYVDPTVEEDKLIALIAHEYFHNWVPNAMHLTTPKGEYGFKREWFTEGFTEYISRQLLLEENIINENYFIEQLNNDIINIANNPSAYEAHMDIAKRKDFGAAQKKLSYYRGALIAQKWNTELKAKGSSIKELMRYLFEKAKNSEGKIEDTDIFDFGGRYNLDFRTDIEHYIDQGLPIQLPDNAFVNYQLKPAKINLFYPGFDVDKSAREKVIQGVDSLGPAFQAGLRNGMTYVSRRNSNRWSNNWSDEEPYTVTVLVEGTEENISFFPLGEPINVPIYQRKSEH